MNQAKIWVSQAIYKFKVAVALLDAQLWQDSCLASQQASELSGKAILCHCDIDFRKTHDIGLIYKKAEEEGILEMSGNLVRAANQMTRDYLEGRYPRPDSERPPFLMFDETDAKERLRWAMSFIDMVSNLIPEAISEYESEEIHKMLDRACKETAATGLKNRP
jgi:Uncharacterized conserved protein related to C-terminal domain of eukaryotic chaperone, SACSIN